MENDKVDFLVAQAYVREPIGGFGVAGDRHDGGSQDALWPVPGVKLPLVEHFRKVGRLYLLSDGMTRCADGHMASQLAVQTVGPHYYASPYSEKERPTARLVRLQKAVWQAHLKLMAWNEQFFCGQKEAHPEGQDVIYTHAQLVQLGKLKDDVADCPLCSKRMVGLRTTLLAATIYGSHLFLIGLGDSVALRIPADSKRPIEFLYWQEKNPFLGAPDLSYTKAGQLPYIEKELKANDLIVLCSDGVIDTLRVYKGEIEWGTYLRRQLKGPISQAVPNFVKDLHRYRTTSQDARLNDDLTMLAMQIPERGRGVKNPRSRQKKKVLLRAAAYAGEAVEGVSVLNPLHPVRCHLWPSPTDQLFTDLSAPEMLLSGRLYLLANGLNLCADAHLASKLAAHTVGMAYYAHSGHVQDSPLERNRRLTKAIWQAHKKMQEWDEKFFCWRKENHSPQRFTKEETIWRNNQPLCPRCGQLMAGLYSSLVAAVLRGQNLSLVGLGETAALRLPANPNEPLEFLLHSKSKEQNFLGMAGLSHHDLYRTDITLQPGDRLLLCGNEVIQTLEGWQKAKGQDWQSHLRQQLTTSDLPDAVQKLIKELHQFRHRHWQLRHDDLTFLLIALPKIETLSARRNQVMQVGEALKQPRLASEGNLEPHLYKNVMEAAEVALLHEDATTIWSLYGVALRERSLAQVRKAASLHDPDALALMANAVQAGDMEASRWLEAMERAQQKAKADEHKVIGQVRPSAPSAPPTLPISSAPPTLPVSSAPPTLPMPSVVNASKRDNQQAKPPSLRPPVDFTQPSLSSQDTNPRRTRPIGNDFFEPIAPPHINQRGKSFTQPATAALLPRDSKKSKKSKKSHDPVADSNPSIAYVISSEKSFDYLNGTSGLLARDDLYTRQIVLDHDSRISTPHAVIRFEKSGRVTVRDLHSRNGTFVNGQPLSFGVAVELNDRSRIRFGPSSEYELDLSQRRLLSMGGNRPFDLSQENLWVVTRYRLRKTITLNNKQLSNPHLLIRPNDPDRPLSFQLRDLGSLNGTFIYGLDLRQMRNGTFIAEQEVEIRVGRHAYKIKAEWINMAFKSGVLIGNRYMVEKQISMGAMSELYLVKDNQSPNGQVMVAKVPYTRHFGEDRVGPAFEREIKLTTTLKHANLLQGEDSYTAPVVDESYLIMPYIDGYDLRTLLSRRHQKQGPSSGLRLADVQEIFKQLLSAVEYLHNQGWVHCDLKPNNILLSKDGELFLIDLGAATPIGKPASFHSRAYSAPETGSARIVNEASDIYSLGKIFFELLTNQEVRVLGALSASQASAQGAARQDTTTSKQSKEPQRPVGLRSLLQEPEHGRDFPHIISKATSQAPIDRYPDVEALREALKEAYTRPMSKAVLDQDGPADLAKLVREG